MGHLLNSVWADFDCQKVQHISCNTGSRALPDMYALAFGRCAPSSVVCTHQAMHSSLCYNYYILSLYTSPRVNVYNTNLKTHKKKWYLLRPCLKWKSEVVAKSKVTVKKCMVHCSNIKAILFIQHLNWQCDESLGSLHDICHHIHHSPKAATHVAVDLQCWAL